MRARRRRLVVDSRGVLVVVVVDVVVGHVVYHTSVVPAHVHTSTRTPRPTTRAVGGGVALETTRVPDRTRAREKLRRPP